MFREQRQVTQMGQSTPPIRHIVLVVEDESILRMAAVDFVEDAGFDVVEAKDADEAVRILESRTDIRIILTDIDMPGSINGCVSAWNIDPSGGVTGVQF